MWQILTFGAILFHSLGKVLNRKVLREGNVSEYLFLWNIIASFFYIPAALLFGISIPSTTDQWLGVILGIILYTIGGFIGFHAIRHTEASLYAPLGAVKVLFLMFFSWILLGENITFNKFWGTIFMFLGIVVLSWKEGAFRKFKELGVKLTLLTAFIISIIATVEKFSMNVSISPVFYGLMMYLIPGLIYGLLPENRTIRKPLSFLSKKWKIITLSAFCYAAMYYLQLFAFKLADVSLVFPLLQLSILVTVILGFFILGEKSEKEQRLLGGALMTVGTMLILAK